MEGKEEKTQKDQENKRENGRAARKKNIRDEVKRRLVRKNTRPLGDNRALVKEGTFLVIFSTVFSYFHFNL